MTAKKIGWAISLVLALASIPVSLSAKAELPDQETTEAWLVRHLEAWDDNNTPRVRVKECVINRTTTTRNDVLNMRGIILPIEILQVGTDQHVDVRVRVREPHSGTYAMSRECNQRNSGCAGGEGNFTAERYLDFRVTYERDFSGTNTNLTYDKARQTRCALLHYAKLCNGELAEEEKDSRFCS